MSDPSEYGVQAEQGERGAQAALERARAASDPTPLIAFLSDAPRHGEAFHDGALHHLCAMLVPGDAAQLATECAR